MFLLGTQQGQAATKTEVKYEGPNQITVNEEKDEQIIVPGLGSPPFAPSFFHQGSNFFFNPQFTVPGMMPFGIERVITPFQPPNDITIVTPEVKSEKIVETVIVQDPHPLIEIEESIEGIPQLIEIDRIPIELPRPNPPVKVLVEEPCLDVEINNGFPVFTEKRFPPSGGMFISEVDVHMNEIPPPPELPPLIMSEIPKPLFLQEKKNVILIPSVPEVASFYPPSVMVAENSLIPTDCAQNIIMERFLPNIAFENGKLVELISIPATKRAPVVSSIIY